MVRWGGWLWSVYHSVGGSWEWVFGGFSCACVCWSYLPGSLPNCLLMT